jgi:hypothetical protein
MKIILEAKREPPIIRIRLLKRRKREVKEGSKTWWLMEGSKAWWSMEGSKTWWPMEGSKAWWPLEGEGESPFHLLHFPPNNLYPNLQFFPLTLQFYFTMVLSRYSRLPFLSFDLKITIAHLNVTSLPHLHCRLDFD